MNIEQLNYPYIAILRGIRSEEVAIHAKILYQQGFRAIEVPLNSPDPFVSIQYLLTTYQRDCFIGAGTVTKVAEVEQLASMDVNLIVTPNTNVAVIKAAKTKGMVVAAGFTTTTEAFTAIDAGADILKLFPAANLGLGYLKAIKSVLPKSIQVFAVGGIEPNDVSIFLQAGCAGFGLGSALYKAGQSSEQTQVKAVGFMQAYSTQSNTLAKI